MKKLVSICVLLLLTIFISKAQFNSPTVVASAGSFSQNGGYSLSTTVGESVVTTGISNNSILTQGFQQPIDQYVSAQPFIHDLKSIRIFPNPTFQTINVEAITASVTTLHIEVFDIINRRIISTPITCNTLINLDLTRLPKGVYLFTLRYNSGQDLFYCKIIKI